MAVVGLLAVSAQPVAAEVSLVWPTPNPAWAENRPASQFVQPTVSGRIESAFFGCVRNDGGRFHEAIDLRPISRDRRGEATDPIFTVMDGVVRYVNRIAGNSGYGRYVVIEHDGADLSAHTLYAHMESFREGIEAGVRVRAGQVIGTMGRTAGGYTIPRERAHLHFEIGFRVSDDFDDWYEWRGFTTENRHGSFNGLNLIGMDPLEFFNDIRAGKVAGVGEYVESLPEAFVLRVRSDRRPDYIQRYPSLLERPWIPANLAGWEIGFTWYGLPKRWRALGSDEVAWEGDETVTVVSFDRETLLERSCRNTILIRNSRPVIGSHTERVLQLLFGFR